MVLYLAVTSKQQAVEQKIKNFLTKWRQVQQKVPLPEMTELLITPQLPEYPKIAEEVFMLLLDGKLRSRTEILKFLKPLAPPPPPPPPPPKRGRGAKAAAAAAAQPAPAVTGKRKGKAAAQAPAVTANAPESAKPTPAAKKAAPPPAPAKSSKPAKPGKAAKPVAHKKNAAKSAKSGKKK